MSCCQRQSVRGERGSHAQTSSSQSQYRETHRGQSSECFFWFWFGFSNFSYDVSYVQICWLLHSSWRITRECQPAPCGQCDHLGLSGVMDHCIRHWQQPAPVRQIIEGFSLKTASKLEDGNFSDNFAEDSGKTWCRQHFLELNLRRNLVIFLASKIVDLGLWTMHRPILQQNSTDFLV